MKKPPAIFGWQKFFAAALTSMLLLGNALAGGTKNPGVPTVLAPKLIPLTPSNIARQPVAPVLVAAPSPPPAAKCEWVSEPERFTYMEGQSGSIGGMAVDICGCCGPRQVWVGGASYRYAWQTLQSSSLTQVCK